MNAAPLEEAIRLPSDEAGVVPSQALPSGPSSLYRAGPWSACVALSRLLPKPVLIAAAKSLAFAYRVASPARAGIVRSNLLPLVDNSPEAARLKARELFQNFAVKLADLWRYESGQPIDGLFGELTGWNHFETARARGRGVLLVTVHLGNWEFGAPLLTRRGVRLQVITQAEPDARLTASRQRARARWGINTLPLGDDPFAAVDIIRGLEAGHAVALLMDRPPAATAATVELFGRPFAASISAAVLARATGCAVVPVYIPRTPGGYVVHTLPEVPYDRPALRDPGARLELTQRILGAFSPALRAHASQWYHFVPIWPAPHPSSHAIQSSSPL
ncbi:MAG: Kdo2-lipid lauroyltransferase/acyltransferase [Verrucomicrobiota bacterium]|jgi:KDO2-lipid IV(A) lauroyltransferase